MSLRTAKRYYRGRAARRIIDSEDVGETWRRLQALKDRRRFQNLFTQTPSSARAQQQTPEPSGSKPGLTREGKFYAPPTRAWRSQLPKAPKEEKKVVVLRSRGTQASTPIKRTRDAKVGVKPVGVNKANQTEAEEKETAPEEDERDGPVVLVADNSQEASAIPPRESEATKQQMKRIARAMVPITNFVKRQNQEEVERRVTLENIKETQETLQGKVDSVIGIAGDTLEKEGAILSAIQDCSDKVEPCKGPHIDEDTLLEIPDQIGEVREIVESYMGEFHSFATNIQLQLMTMSSGLKDLRGEQQGLAVLIEQEKKAREEAAAQSNIETDPDPRFQEASKCTCAQRKANSKDGSFLRCQNCMNTFNGEQFLINNDLYEGLPENEAVATRIGKIIQCIDVDAAGRLAFHMGELHKETKSWNVDKKADGITALFNLSMQRKSPKSSKVILSHVKKFGSKRDKDNVMAKCVNGAVSSGKDSLQDLLQCIDPADRKRLINAPIFRDGNVKTYNIFEAVRKVDTGTLEYLIDGGASLEVLEGDQNIMHAIIQLSSKKSLITEEYENDLVNILEVVYEKAGLWWKLREGISDDNQDERCSREAISFLVSMKNKRNENALQYSARVAPPSIVKRIVNNYPYKFITDAVSFGKLDGKVAYVVDEIEPHEGPRGCSSVLDTITNREDTGNAMVQIEPFRTMLQDKWYRYRVFYWIWFLSYLLYLCVLSACAVGRYTGARTIAELYARPGAHYRLAGEVLCLLCLPLFFYGEVCDYLRYGWYWDWNIDRVKAFRMANVIFVICILLTVILRVALSPFEDVFLCMALITSWMMLTQFLIPLSQTLGLFPIVYFKVFKDDFLKCYSWIFLPIFLGCTIAVYCAYQGSLELVPEIPKGGFFQSLFSIILLTFGFLETDYVMKARLPGLGILLFIIYVWIGHILLLNLFIAMVNDRYTAIKMHQKDDWIRIKAWFAMLMDRRLPVAARIQFNGLSHLKQESFTFKLITKLKMFTTTNLIYTKRIILGVTNEEEKQLIVIQP